MGAIHQTNLSLSKIQGRIQNASFAGASGATGEGDRGAFQGIPLHTGNPYDQNSYIERYRQLYKLYETSWEARKIVRIPVEDALRKPWEIQGIPEEMADILKRTCDDMKFINVLSRSLMLERLLGGCLTFMGLDAEKDDPAKKFSPRLGQSKLRFLNVVPVSRISRVNWETNPLEYEFMRPNEYMINGQNVHISRCLIWDGDPLIDPHDYAIANYQTNFTGFGQSKLIPIWDDIVKAIGTRQAAFQMIQTNNAIIMAISELQDLSGTNPGKATLAKLKEIANSLSVYRAAIIQKDKVDITQQPASFGSVPELIMSFLQVISAASDIPATRFIGQAPGGLNATGASDLENYYNMEDAYQRQRITPNILKLYDVIGYQKWPGLWQKERLKLEIVWPPLWNIKELEEAQKNQIELDNMFKAWESGLMSDEKAIEELNIKKVFSVDLDEKDIDVQKSAEDNAEFYREGDPGTGGPDPQAPKPKQFQVPGHIGAEPKTKMDDVSEHGPKAKMPETLENADKWITVHPNGPGANQAAQDVISSYGKSKNEIQNTWLTVKPNGPNGKGQHVEIGEGGIIKSGMGGKYNGRKIGEFKKKAEKDPNDKSNVPQHLRQIFGIMRDEMHAGGIESMKDLGEGGKTEAVGRVSSHAQWYRDLNAEIKSNMPEIGGIDKKTFESVLSKKEAGKALTDRQMSIWKAMEGKAEEYNKEHPDTVREIDAADMKRKGFEPNYGQPLSLMDVNVGDKLLFDDDEYTVKGFDKEGNMVLKDGEVKRLDPFDTINPEAIKRSKQKGKAKIGNAVDDPVIYDPEQVMIGMKVEREHNDLTLGDPVEIARIVRAHLQEDSDYYQKLKKAGL